MGRESDTDTKECSVCEREKSLSEFHRDSSRADGHKAACKPCRLDRESEYREEHGERWQARRRERYKNEPEKRRKNCDRAVDWAEENPERKRKIALDYYHRNSKKVNKKTREWEDENRERVRKRKRLYQAARRASVNNGILTEEDWDSALERAGHQCVYCGSDGPIEMDHVIPLALDGEHNAGNIVPACQKCNRKKGDSPPEDWVVSRFGRQRWREVQAFLP